jgi:hypothetical protein
MKQEHFNLVNRLHTDVLEEKYGEINAKVLRHDNIIREAHLIDKKGLSRTYAITFLRKYKNKKIIKINNEIKKGKPIGKAFREYGYHIRKNVIDVFVIKLPIWLRKAFYTKEKYAKARLSEFYAKNKKDPPIIYGTVVEIYSPDFRLPVINNIDISQVHPTTECFEHAGISKEKVWDKLTDENGLSENKEEYEHAKKDSLKNIFKIKKRIHNYLNKKNKIFEVMF